MSAESELTRYWLTSLCFASFFLKQNTEKKFTGVMVLVRAFYCIGISHTVLLRTGVAHKILKVYNDPAMWPEMDMLTIVFLNVGDSYQPNSVYRYLSAFTSSEMAMFQSVKK